MSNYQISLSLEDARKEAEKFFREKALSSASSQINALFYERHHWEHPSRKNGTGHQMIKEMIENKFLAEDSQKILNAYFEANWENILKEAMDKAMRKAAEHKANQLAFSQAGLKNPREKRESYLDRMFDSDHIQNGA